MKSKVLSLITFLAALCCGAWFQLPQIIGPTLPPVDHPPAMGETEAVSEDSQLTPETVSDQSVAVEPTSEDMIFRVPEDQPTPVIVPDQPENPLLTPVFVSDKPSDVQQSVDDLPGQLYDTPEPDQENDYPIPQNGGEIVQPEPDPTELIPTITPTPKEESGKGSGGGFATVVLVIIIAAAVVVGGYSAYHLYKGRKAEEERKKNENLPYRSKEFGTMVTITSSGPYICSGCKGQGSRDYQEDSYWYGTEIGPERAVCVMIADGMGGMDNGAESSSIAAAKFNNAVPHIETDKDIPSKLWDLSRAINAEIYTVNSRKGMNGGTTLVSAYIIDNRLYWISIGDSRIYLCRDGVLSSVNEEHELESRMYGELLDGKVDLDDIRSTPNRELRKLTSNLGRSEIPLIDQNYSAYHLKCGDKLLLCSDGVSGTLSEQEMLECLESPDPEINCHRIADMIERKNKAHQDNYSAIVIYCATEDGK